MGQAIAGIPAWERSTIALEYSVCDLRRNIGGSLDVLGWDHLLDVMVLLDLKTLGRQPHLNPGPAGYLSMLIDHHKLVVDECLTMWAARGEAHLGDRQSPTECLEKWEDAYDIWNSQLEPFIDERVTRSIVMTKERPPSTHRLSRLPLEAELVGVSTDRLVAGRGCIVRPPWWLDASAHGVPTRSASRSRSTSLP